MPRDKFGCIGNIYQRNPLVVLKVHISWSLIVARQFWFSTFSPSQEAVLLGWLYRLFSSSSGDTSSSDTLHSPLWLHDLSPNPLAGHSDHSRYRSAQHHFNVLRLSPSRPNLTDHLWSPEIARCWPQPGSWQVSSDGDFLKPIPGITSFSPLRLSECEARALIVAWCRYLDTISDARTRPGYKWLGLETLDTGHTSS